MSDRKASDRQILDAIERHWVTHWTSPTCRELGAMVGLSSPATVLVRLQNLERKGLVESRRSGARVIYRVTI